MQHKPVTQCTLQLFSRTYVHVHTRNFPSRIHVRRCPQSFACSSATFLESTKTKVQMSHLRVTVQELTDRADPSYSQLSFSPSAAKPASSWRAALCQGLWPTPRIKTLRCYKYTEQTSTQPAPALTSLLVDVRHDLSVRCLLLSVFFFSLSHSRPFPLIFLPPPQLTFSWSPTPTRPSAFTPSILHSLAWQGLLIGNKL